MHVKREWAAAAIGRGAVIAFVFCLIAIDAFAQQVPSTVAPGRIEQPFQAPPAIPNAAGAPIVPPGLAPAQAPPGADKLRFTLEKLIVEDATVFSPADFATLYQDLLGHEVTLQQIYEIAAAITAKYGSRGYILSQAVVPAQRIADGVVRIKVVEGFIDQVTFKNETGGPVDDSLQRAYGAKIAAARPLRAADLERYLLLMNDLPGVTARS
ncbi:MAG: ShlB/FhaC/HecB family hemolysin secretion/activation protein, partial [Alphaproteobacteria bacterium]|nr:ShlB/FhaC/HecB family hemolysin secretion/activation protein [Alphaproteobacteria bacterium]